MVAGRSIAALASIAAAVVSLLIGASQAAAQFDDGWMSGVRRGPATNQQPASRTDQGRAGFRRSEKDRFVVGLYDGSREGSADLSRLHRYLELPLNHLGLTVHYYDISKGLPEEALLKRARGIVTWFDRPVPAPRSYLAWAAKIAASGTRFVILDEVGMSRTVEDIEAANALLSSLGLRMTGRWIGGSEAGRITEHTAEMIGFERKFANPLPGYMVFDVLPATGRGAAIKSHLTVESRQIGATPQVRSSTITTGPGGGLAVTGYVRQLDAATGRLGWIIDPFRFLTAALDLSREPVPDTTTLVGRRIYFSHVDGDGWTIPVAGGGNAAEAIAGSVIERFPDFYVSVGLVASDTMPGRFGGSRASEVARRLFALPHVEPASSTYSQPIDWEFLQHYDRRRELARVFAIRARAIAEEQREIGALAKLGRHRYTALIERGFSVRGPMTPRANMLRPFDLDREVRGALAATSALAPPDKPTRLYLWSGTMRPYEAAVASVREAGALNLSGGGGRLDADFPSIMYLSPLARTVGEQRQIYAVNASDSDYTSGWRHSASQFAKLALTWANTEAPRRLKPMSLNYHMAAGARPDAIDVLKQLNGSVRAERVVPMAASEYAAIVDGFADTQIVQLSTNRWRISNRGTLGTVRLDDAEALHADLRSSSGVLGYIHHGKSLYVALDPAQPDAIVAVTTAAPRRQGHDRPYLVESRWRISSLKVGACGIQAIAKGLGPGEMTWAELRPGRYEVSASREGSDVVTLDNVDVGPDQRLRLSLKADASAGLQLKITCQRGSPLTTSSTRRQPR